MEQPQTKNEDAGGQSRFTAGLGTIFQRSKGVMRMIPTIEMIVDDLVAGLITKQQAVAWLHAHAEDAGSDLRDSFAMAALAHSSSNCDDAANNVGKAAAWAYELAVQ